MEGGKEEEGRRKGGDGERGYRVGIEGRIEGV